MPDEETETKQHAAKGRRYAEEDQYRYVFLEHCYVKAWSAGSSPKSARDCISVCGLGHTQAQKYLAPRDLDRQPK
jgi:hypothetical protein